MAVQFNRVVKDFHRHFFTSRYSLGEIDESFLHCELDVSCSANGCYQIFMSFPVEAMHHPLRDIPGFKGHHFLAGQIPEDAPVEMRVIDVVHVDQRLWMCKVQLLN